MSECDCLQRIADAGVREYGETCFLSNTKTLWDLKTGKTSRVICPPVELRYRATKKDGSPSSKWKTAQVWGDFCPFCGQRNATDEMESPS